MIPLKRHSRIIFLSYIFNDCEGSVEDIASSLEIFAETDPFYDKEFTNKLVDLYNQASEMIWNIIYEYTQATDYVLLCILAVGITEMVYRYNKKDLEQKYKVILSECIKLADLFDMPSEIVNAVLYKCYEQKEYLNFPYIVTYKN